MQNLVIDYDSKNDILYVSIGVPVPSICEEKEEGIIIRKSIEKNMLSGVTILDYKYRKNHKIKINVPEEINLDTIKV